MLSFLSYLDNIAQKTLKISLLIGYYVLLYTLLKNIL